MYLICTLRILVSAIVDEVDTWQVAEKGLHISAWTSFVFLLLAGIAKP